MLGNVEQFNGREGETATLLSRCPLNFSGLGGGFAPRHLNRSTASFQYPTSDIMLQSSFSSETLAHWNYTQTEWRDFASYVLNNRIQEYKSLRYWVIGIVAVAFLIMIFLVLIPYLMLKPSQGIWRADVWGPVFGVAIVTCLILAAIVFVRLLFQEKDRTLKLSSGGDVLITLTAVIVNGSSCDWGFEKSGWRLQNVERKTVATGEGENIEILQFKCSTDYVGVRSIKHTIDKIERIPIPVGKETEAERIIERLSAEKNRFAENQVS